LFVASHSPAVVHVAEVVQPDRESLQTCRRLPAHWYWPAEQAGLSHAFFVALQRPGVAQEALVTQEVRSALHVWSKAPLQR
jgi:hypothetical protein